MKEQWLESPLLIAIEHLSPKGTVKNEHFSFRHSPF